MSIQRYRRRNGEMVRDPEGLWVLFDDIDARVHALDKANATLLRRAQAAERREALEQEVLDAMGDWPETDLRDPLDAPPASQRQAAWRALIRLCRAELARRGLKP